MPGSRIGHLNREIERAVSEGDVGRALAAGRAREAYLLRRTAPLPRRSDPVPTATMPGLLEWLGQALQDWGRRLSARGAERQRLKDIHRAKDRRRFLEHCAGPAHDDHRDGPGICHHCGRRGLRHGASAPCFVSASCDFCDKSPLI